MSILAVVTLAGQCAPAVAPETLLAVARVESGLDPLAIGVNGRPPRRLHPATRAEAVATANRLMAQGANIDVGLGQINVRNLKPLGLTVTDAFDPCHNLEASAQALAADYAMTAPLPGAEQAALRTSLSLYNTGDAWRGFRNGYVAKVTAAARQVVPSIESGAGGSLYPSASPSDWNVFANSRTDPSFVLTPARVGEAP